MVNPTSGQPLRRIATNWRWPNRDAYDGTLGLHSQAVRCQPLNPGRRYILALRSFVVVAISQTEWSRPFL